MAAKSRAEAVNAASQVLGALGNQGAADDGPLDMLAPPHSSLRAHNVCQQGKINRSSTLPPLSPIFFSHPAGLALLSIAAVGISDSGAKDPPQTLNLHHGERETRLISIR